MTHNVNATYDQKFAPLAWRGRGSLVYYGGLTNRTRLVKAFSYALPAVCVVFLAAANFLEAQISLKETAILGVLTCNFPLMAHALTKSYVTRMYYDADKDTFTASTYGLLTREVLHVFTPEDVEVTPTKAMTSCKVRGIPLIVHKKNFFDLEMYQKMMGYDKPHGYNISPEQEEEYLEKIRREKQEKTKK